MGDDVAGAKGAKGESSFKKVKAKRRTLMGCQAICSKVNVLIDNLLQCKSN